MARIELKDVAHSYNGGKDYALKPLNMVWEDGRTYALLGPSGCGKTTMLNIISGLLKPSEGRLLFDGEDVTDSKTEGRNIAQVFQFPVIYSTMTVAQNLAFPLVCRGYPVNEIKKRVDSVAALLGLGDLMQSPARRLTADQKQLVSMGRGLVREDVSAILLDEPLTVIDPQMKFELRRKLKQINREFGITMVFVTHDQTEAMTFAEEVVVMKDGEIMQRGAPQDLFERPGNTFVGYFIGSPPMNFLKAEIAEGKLSCPGTKFSEPAKGLERKEGIHIGFRPEFVELVDPESANFATGRIEKIDNLGSETIVTLTLSGNQTVRAKTTERFRMKAGEPVGLSISNSRIQLYSRDQRIGQATEL